MSSINTPVLFLLNPGANSSFHFAKGLVTMEWWVYREAFGLNVSMERM
jgi:hypothetical protein